MDFWTEYLISCGATEAHASLAMCVLATACALTVLGMLVAFFKFLWGMK